MIRLTLLVACLVTSPAFASDWVMQAGASRLEFVAAFEGNPAPGSFRRFDTSVRFEPDQLKNARLDVVVQIDSADMRSSDINQAIVGAEWFDATRFPTAEFHSMEIVAVAPGRYSARGTLTLKGVDRRVDVPFGWMATGAEARMVGELTVKRIDYGIGTGRWAATTVIGPDVSIRFTVLLKRAGG